LGRHALALRHTYANDRLTALVERYWLLIGVGYSGWRASRRKALEW
jgi:hypothetical protein